MITISKRFLERAKPALKRYQKVLTAARSRDVNEADTVTIVSDFMADVLGYDKYEDLTSELAVRCTFCDLAVRRDDSLQYLIEVKAIGRDLRENHLRQAVDYGANQGIEWVLLTNGVEWQAHRIRFEQPISHDLVFSVDLLDPDAKLQDLLDRLFLISKEGSRGGDIDRYYRQREATSRYVVAQVLLAEPVLAFIRRQLRQMFDGVKIDAVDLGKLLRDEVLKRDVLEGDKADVAAKRVRRAARKRARTRRSDQGASDGSATLGNPAMPTPQQPAAPPQTA